MESEFGKGLCYNLGLFLVHVGNLTETLKVYKDMREKNPDSFSEESAVEIWFNGAADHMYELQWEQAPKHLQKRCKELQAKCLNWRLSLGRKSKPKLDNAYWAIQESMDLLRLIDKANGVSTIKGDWE